VLVVKKKQEKGAAKPRKVVANRLGSSESADFLGAGFAVRGELNQGLGG
jgi:hypothetical protein